MKESYLHALWRRKQIPFLNLKLTDGRSLEIIHYGHHNKHAHGPDFSMGIIVIEGVEEYGSIELHLRSSDWYKHGHQYDEAYNHVILHVVFLHDREVIQNNRLIPTLQISEFVDPIHRKRFEHDLSQHKHHHGCLFLGQNSSTDSGPFRTAIDEMKQRALLHRYFRKNEPFMSANHPAESWAYFLLGQAFGSPSNKEAFAEFCEYLPLSVCKAYQGNELVDMMLRESGITNQKKINWVRSGFRPSSSPERRFKQFASLMRQESRTLNEFLTLEFDVFRKRCELLGFSLGFIRHLFINAAIPYQYALSLKYGNDPSSLKEINQLKNFPKEDNFIIRAWEQLNVSCQHAYDTQALIALDQMACQLKKCLTCSLGKLILNAKENSENNPVF